MAKISLYDIFTGSTGTKWLEPGVGINLDYSADYHSVIIELSGASVPVDISQDLNPTLGGDLNTNGHSIISGPGQDIIIQPGVGGDLILNGLIFPDTDGDAGDLLGTDGNGNLVWYKVPGITDSQAGYSYYVDGSAATAGDGTKEHPFQTFQEALDIVDNNDTIIMYEGIYSGDHGLSKSITIKAIDGQEVLIFGKTTISNTATIRTIGISFENNTDLAIVNTGTLYSNNGSFTRQNDQGVISDGALILTNVVIRTRIASDGYIELTNVDSDKGVVTTTDHFVLHSAIKAPMIDHVAGYAEIRNAPTFDYDDDNSSIGLNNSIKSTATTGFLIIDNVSLKQSTGWSHIAKTGTCDWVINNVGRNPLADVLTGVRRYYITEASDLSSYYVPTNYSITTNVDETRDIEEASITDHLMGIDAKLGIDSFTPSNALWVASNALPGGNGSKNRPFDSIAAAVAAANPLDTIYVYAGDYLNEEIVVNKDIFIDGLGNVNLVSSTIHIVDGLFLGINDVSISGPFEEIPFVVEMGHFKIQNCNIESSAPTAIHIVEFTSDSEIHHCTWQGALLNEDANGHLLLVSDINDASANIVTNNVNSKTVVRDSMTIGTVTHTAGSLSLINVGQITKDGSNTSIHSTANDAAGNYLYITYSSTKQPDGSYGIIDKSGECDYKLGINDFGASDNFNGDGEVENITSDQVKVTFTPTSYTPDSNSLTDHLEQIDILLGEALIKPSRLYYVDDVDALNDIYMAIAETTFGFDSSIYITPGAIAQFMLHDDFEFKPGINLIGTGAAENVIVQMPTTIPNLVITSALSGMVHETLWRDIKLNSPVIVNQTLSGDELHFENMTINGDITVNSGKMIIRDTKINGVITISGGNLEIWNCELIGTVVMGSGSLYINGVKQYISDANPSFNISGGEVIIDNIRASNTLESIFRITGGKTIVTSIIIADDSYNTVINQDVGGSIYIGINNIVVAAKTISGNVLSLGFGVS